MILRLFCFFGLLISPLTNLFAQDGDRAGAFDGSAFIPAFQWDESFDFASYELGPGDVLNFHLWGGKTLNVKIYVSATFQLFVPYIGAVDVRGVKLGNLNKIVSERLGKFFKNTFAEVALQRPRDFLVQLSGEVNTPGEKPANALTRLHEFLTKYGGVRPTGSVLSVIIENSRTKTVNEYNYQEYLLRSKQEGNPFLRDGDRIHIPFQKNIAFLEGALSRTGRFEFAEDFLPLRDVVEKYFGGFSGITSVGGKVQVTRLEADGPKTYLFEHREFLDKNFEGGFYNFQLRPGDKIYFPIQSLESPILNDKVFVTGEVRAGGAFPFKPGLPLGAYISFAGGITARANYSGTVVYKASGARLSVSNSGPVEPGDTIYIPEKTFKFWQDHLVILTTFLGVVTTTLALTR